MKKTLLILVSLLLCCSCYLNAQKMVLLEEATNTGCAPCAAANPWIDQLIQNNLDKIVAIKYHWDFPSTTDPFYLHNPGENDQRINYYSLNAVPSIMIDGSKLANYGNFNQSLINQYAAQSTPFDMTVYTVIDQAANTIKTYTYIQALENATITGNLFVAVVEDYVTGFNAPNGETSFHDVFVKFLTSSTGDIIPSSWETGDYCIIESDWDYTNNYIYNEDELDIRAFIQNPNTKGVYQAARGVHSMPEAGSMPYNYDAEISVISNIPKTTCLSTCSPSFTLRNNGNNEITSALISYNFNNETSVEYNWTGSLSTLESVDINLGDLDFTLVNGDNNFNVSIVSINGEADEYTKNNCRSFSFASSLNTINFVKLVLRTDNAPEETTWDVKVYETGEVIASGGPYATANSMNVEQIELPEEAECYIFTIYDAGGDGICCANGSGLFGLETNTGKVIANGGQFKDSVSAFFSAYMNVGISNIPNATKESLIYPNPANDKVYVEFVMENSGDATIDIFSLPGRKVKTVSLSNTGEGDHKVELNVRDLPAGMYILRLQHNNIIETHKLNITK